MKKLTWFSIIAMLLSILLINGCKVEKTDTAFLKEVLKILEQIESAAYYWTAVSSMPHDTAKFTKQETKFMKIFVNPSDTLIGASSITYSGDDTTKIEDFYDGMVRGRYNWEKQLITIDSFQNHPYPFRLVHNPFHITIKEIIKYALTTQDSIKTEFHDYGDSVKFSLMIYDKHVYFHVKPIVIKNDYIPEDEISYYDIWFHKKDKLPYRMKSQWHHLTFFEECTEVKLNTTHKVDFISTDHFPANFEIKKFKRGKGKRGIICKEKLLLIGI